MKVLATTNFYQPQECRSRRCTGAPRPRIAPFLLLQHLRTQRFISHPTVGTSQTEKLMGRERLRTQAWSIRARSLQSDACALAVLTQCQQVMAPCKLQALEGVSDTQEKTREAPSHSPQQLARQQRASSLRVGSTASQMRLSRNSSWRAPHKESFGGQVPQKSLS